MSKEYQILSTLARLEGEEKNEFQDILGNGQKGTSTKLFQKNPKQRKENPKLRQASSINPSEIPIIEHILSQDGYKPKKYVKQPLKASERPKKDPHFADKELVNKAVEMETKSVIVLPSLFGKIEPPHIQEIQHPKFDIPHDITIHKPENGVRVISKESISVPDSQRSHIQRVYTKSYRLEDQSSLNVSNHFSASGSGFGNISKERSQQQSVFSPDSLNESKTYTTPGATLMKTMVKQYEPSIVHGIEHEPIESKTSNIGSKMKIPLQTHSKKEASTQAQMISFMNAIGDNIGKLHIENEKIIVIKNTSKVQKRTKEQEVQANPISPQTDIKQVAEYRQIKPEPEKKDTRAETLLTRQFSKSHISEKVWKNEALLHFQLLSSTQKQPIKDTNETEKHLSEIKNANGLIESLFNQPSPSLTAKQIDIPLIKKQKTQQQNPIEDMDVSETTLVSGKQTIQKKVEQTKQQTENMIPTNENVPIMSTSNHQAKDKFVHSTQANLTQDQDVLNPILSKYQQQFSSKQSEQTKQDLEMENVEYFPQPNQTLKNVPNSFTPTEPMELLANQYNVVKSANGHKVISGTESQKQKVDESELNALSFEGEITEEAIPQTSLSLSQKDATHIPFIGGGNLGDTNQTQFKEVCQEMRNIGKQYPKKQQTPQLKQSTEDFLRKNEIEIDIEFPLNQKPRHQKLSPYSPLNLAPNMTAEAIVNNQSGIYSKHPDKKPSVQLVSKIPLF